MSKAINLLRIMDYRGHKVHVMQFGRVFQYLFADTKGNIFQDHVAMPPSFLLSLKHKFGLVENPYTQEELTVGEKIVISGAMATIDELKKGQKETTNEMRVASKIVNQLKKNPECYWRAIEMEDGMNYQCLKHDVLIKMKEGEIPFHEINKDTKILSPLQL